MPLKILKELFEILDKDQQITKTPADFLDGFKAKDLHDPALTKFGYLLCNLAGSVNDARLIRNHILWVVFHFGYPRKPFSDDQCRNWLAINSSHIDTVNIFHAEVVPPEIDKSIYLSPSMITEILSKDVNISRPNAKDILDRTWLIYSRRKSIQPPCLKCRRNKCVTVNNLPIVCFFHDKGEIKIKSCGDRLRNIQSVNTTLNKLLTACDESNVNQRFANFEKMLFVKNKFNLLKDNNHLVCSHYFRFPIYRHLDMKSEAYVAIRSKDYSSTIEVIKPSYLGIRLTSSLVNDKIAYYYTDDNIIEILIKDLLVVHFNKPTNPPGHPRSIHDIPPDLMLYSEMRRLADMGKSNKYSIIESFKALYCFDLKKSFHKYPLRLDIFQYIFRQARVDVKIDKSIRKYNDIQLPVKPGMLFIINLLDFLNCMEINSFQLLYKNNEVVIKIKLDNGERFQAALNTDGGQGTQAFRRFLKCDKDKYTIKVKSEYHQLIEQWDTQPLPATHKHTTPIYKPPFEYRIDTAHNVLEIRWASRELNSAANDDFSLSSISHDVDNIFSNTSLPLRDKKKECIRQLNRLKTCLNERNAKKRAIMRIESFINIIQKKTTINFEQINQSVSDLLDEIH